MRTVTEEGIVEAMRFLWTRMKIIVEPSGAVPLAALMADPDAFRGMRDRDRASAAATWTWPAPARCWRSKPTSLPSRASHWLERLAYESEVFCPPVLSF